MNKLLLIATFSETIEKWNEKLDSIASEYMDSPFFWSLSRNRSIYLWILGNFLFNKKVKRMYKIIHSFFLG